MALAYCGRLKASYIQASEMLWLCKFAYVAKARVVLNDKNSTSDYLRLLCRRTLSFVHTSLENTVLKAREALNR